MVLLTIGPLANMLAGGQRTRCCILCPHVAHGLITTTCSFPHRGRNDLFNSNVHSDSSCRYAIRPILAWPLSAARRTESRIHKAPCLISDHLHPRRLIHRKPDGSRTLVTWINLILRSHSVLHFLRRSGQSTAVKILQRHWSSSLLCPH